MNKRTLIVEDSLTVRMDLREALEDAGFDCVECATLAQARAALADGMPALVLLDNHLPDGDGGTWLAELRATPQGGGDCVVLILSNASQAGDRLRGIAHGADEYVGKPYDRTYVVDRARELVRQRQARVQTPDPHVASVLLIDDSETFREALCDALEPQGYDIHMAAHGEEGLRQAAALRPNAVIVDQHMPGIDGAAVIRRLRLDPALRHTPCLLLTADEGPEAELRALEAGADAFARKQDDVDLILARVAAMLRSAKSSLPDQGASLSGPKRLLLVDDSANVLAELGAMLRDDGYDVIAAGTGELALELLAVQPVDAVLLDVQMPGIGGLETCRRIKSAPALRDIPVVLLTAFEGRASMLAGLEAGADDYVAKPAEPMVLLARIRALLRRLDAKQPDAGAAAAPSADIVLGSLRVSEAHRVWLEGQEIALTTQEFELLYELARSAGTILSREDLFKRIRGIDYDGLDRSIDGRISKLRKKLGDDAEAPKRIRTIWGKGYLLVPDAW